MDVRFLRIGGDIHGYRTKSEAVFPLALLVASTRCPGDAEQRMPDVMNEAGQAYTYRWCRRYHTVRVCARYISWIGLWSRAHKAVGLESRRIAG